MKRVIKFAKRFQLAKFINLNFETSSLYYSLLLRNKLTNSLRIQVENKIVNAKLTTKNSNASLSNSKKRTQELLVLLCLIKCANRVTFKT